MWFVFGLVLYSLAAGFFVTGLIEGDVGKVAVSVVFALIGYMVVDSALRR